MTRGSRQWLLAPVAAVVVGVLALGTGVALSTNDGPAASGAAAPGAAGATALVLYDTSAFPEAAETYAIQTANLVSHFGDWTAKPVTEYEPAELAGYDAVVYLGSAYDEPIPEAFLADVAGGDTPVLWVRDNLWQLTERPHAAQRYGFTWEEVQTAPVDAVEYRGQELTRDPANESGIAQVSLTQPDNAEVLATAVREDGETFPWAVRSGNLTYVGEIPFAYVTPGDRYLAFTDLLFDLLAPQTEQRHRALVRLEDVGPTADPAQLREIADYLHSEQVPFSVAVYPVYEDPKGVQSDGEPQRVRLRDRPEVVDALKYLQQRGGTLLMHGYTHQYQDVDNPYSGVSGADFEFYRAHIDETDAVRLDGPVPEDSPRWARARMKAAAAEFQAVGLPVPEVFEFPHYAGSATDYQVVADQFAARYDRGLYFPGLLSGDEPDHSQGVGQWVPYLVRDVYGSVVVPETLGEITSGYNQHTARGPDELLAAAQRTLVVRDGVASFFFHPFLGLEPLQEMVAGIQDQGYEFVPVESVTSGAGS